MFDKDIPDHFLKLFSGFRKEPKGSQKNLSDSEGLDEDGAGCDAPIASGGEEEEDNSEKGEEERPTKRQKMSRLSEDAHLVQGASASYPDIIDSGRMSWSMSRMSSLSRMSSSSRSSHPSPAPSVMSIEGSVVADTDDED